MDIRHIGEQEATTERSAGNDGLLNCTVVVSVFSQILVNNSIIRYGMYLLWVVLLARCLFSSKNAFWISDHTRVFCLNYGALFVALAACSIFLNTNHMAGNYLQLMRIPLLVAIIGNCVPYNRRAIENVTKVYIGCAVIFAVYVHMKYIPSYSSWITRQTYAFTQKNSAAQIWGSAILLSLLLLKKQRKLSNAVWMCVDAYLIILICLCQCRTAILALAVVAVVYFHKYIRNRAGWFILAAVGALIVLRNERVVQFINQALMITKYRGTDMNTFSSGRLDLWENAFRTFTEHPVWGIGRYYVDCSYLSVLAETGIIGFCFIETIWAKRAISNFQNRRGLPEEDDCLGKCVSLLTVFYMIESLLEGYPPFGPGVSSFMFWLLSAIGDKLKYEEGWKKESYEIEGDE